MSASRERRHVARDNVTARQRILSGAAELFMDRGFHATSVRDISDCLDISQSSLYYHAKNKPQILADLNREFMDELVESMEEIAARDEEPLAKLRAVIRELLNAIAHNKAVVTVVLHERRSLPPDAAVAVQAQRDRVDAIIDGIIVDGIRDGEIVEHRPAVLRLALTGMTNWAYTWYDPVGPLAAEELADEFAAILFDGMKPRQEKPRRKKG